MNNSLYELRRFTATRAAYCRSEMQKAHDIIERDASVFDEHGLRTIDFETALHSSTWYSASYLAYRNVWAEIWEKMQ